jgi:pimeloyl-ACP methyl ester carboxylesterase
MTQFPYGYDPGKTYPLTVYLHGAGSDYPMDGLQTYYDNSQQDTLFTWDEIDPDNVPAPQRGFVIAPWARGNSSYQGLGELDVFQALHETRKNFKIDPDRVYLTGFSMGSGGAWRIASMTPDLWAGVNLASGFWTSDLLDHRIDNVKGLPFVLQAGTEEPRFMEPCKEFYQRFQEAGLKSSLRIIQDMRHTYPHPLFCKNMEELMQYTRKTPSEFSFEAESSEHGGRNGIVMNVPYGDLHGERPRFTCKIEGNTVTINSANTESLRVDLGEGGLGLKGKVKVIWNGKTAHEDDAKSIFLGEPFRTQNYFEK